jgi:hypothetical protein
MDFWMERTPIMMTVCATLGVLIAMPAVANAQQSPPVPPTVRELEASGAEEQESAREHPMTLVTDDGRQLNCRQVWNGGAGRQELRCDDAPQNVRLRRSRAPWHPWTLVAQVGLDGVAGVLSVFPLFGSIALFDAATNYHFATDFYSVEAFAFGTAVAAVMPATATWATGRALGGSGSAWKTILFGSLAGAAVGVPLTFVTFGGEGWLAGQLLSMAVAIPTYHLTYDQPAKTDAGRQLSFGLVPTSQGTTLSMGGTF